MGDVERGSLLAALAFSACSSSVAPSSPAGRARLDAPEWSRTVAGATLAAGDFDGDGDVHRRSASIGRTLEGPKGMSERRADAEIGACVGSASTTVCSGRTCK